MTDDGLKLLQTLIRQALKSNRFPKEADLKAECGDRPWLVDDLISEALVVSLNSFLVPTHDGLKKDGSPASLEAIKDAARMWPVLAELHRSQGPVHQSPKAVSDRLGIAAERVFSLWSVIAASCPRSFASSSGNRVYPVTTVTTSDAVLGRNPFESPQPSADSTGTAGAPPLVVMDRFMGLQGVSWRPSGVSLLTGYNGSGKTSVLKGLRFLRDAFQRNLGHAVQAFHGPEGLRNLSSTGAEPVVLGLTVGSGSWKLQIPFKNGTYDERAEELVTIDDQVYARRGMYQDWWYLEREKVEGVPGRTCFRAAWDRSFKPELKALVLVLESYASYGSWRLEELRHGGEGGGNDAVLDEDGRNLAFVLRNWKAAPRRFNDRFEWVIAQMRKSFPGLVEDIEFDPPASGIVQASIFEFGLRQGIPFSRVADGVLVGLLHLTAIAGAPAGSLVAIDEMENQLHPHAIRALIKAMRERAEENHLTVLLTTHSPIVMNEFRTEIDRFFVMERGHDELPVRLDHVHDSDWLAHFSLGDLYDREEFGAPVPDSQP
jgi:predicted ATPase